MRPVPAQAGSQKHRTTSQQVLELLAHLQTCAAPQYACLLDIAKAFPSTPHTPPHLDICPRVRIFSCYTPT